MNSEDILIKQAIDGNHAALNFVSDNHQAENVAQEVFLKIYLSLPRYRFEGFRTWIGKIAAHKAIDWRRRQQKIAVKEKIMDIDDLLEDAIPNNDLPGERLIEKEQIEKLQTLYKQLPEKYRVIVEKYYFSDKSYQQIAKEEGIALKTVESRLYRARQMLKKQWKEGV